MSDDDTSSEGGSGGGLAVKLGAGVMAIGAMLARSADDCGRVAAHGARGLDDVGRVAVKGDDLGKFGRAARAGEHALPGAARGLPPGLAGAADDTASWLPAGMRHSEEALAARRLVTSEPDIAGEAWQAAAEEALGQAIDWASWQGDEEDGEGDDAPLMDGRVTDGEGPRWAPLHMPLGVQLSAERLIWHIETSPYRLFISGERRSEDSPSIAFHEGTLAPSGLLWRCLAANRACVVLSWPAGLEAEQIGSIRGALLKTSSVIRGGGRLETALAASLEPLTFSSALRLHLLRLRKGETVHVTATPAQLAAVPRRNGKRPTP